MPRHFDDLMLGSLELFCLSAELESFTAAAASAGLTAAAVSRSISRLEARLGVQLFARTTRRVRLTDSGQNYFEQCRLTLNQLVEAEREISGKQKSPTGIVRMSLPTSFGHFRILPLLPEFRQLYPAVQLDLHLSNRNIDFAAEGFDLAVRGRIPPDSGLIARKLEDARLVVVAAPDYLRRRGTPLVPGDLAAHDCIQFLLPRTGQPVPWVLHQLGREVEWVTHGGIQCSEDILGPVTLARHGGGLLQTAHFLVEPDLKQGSLVEVMQDFGGAARAFSLLYPANRHMPQSVRVLIDFLVQRLAVRVEVAAS
ncbi:MAG: LysR substrate-binding domain-containing protein [Pseudomonadota bacterium]|nr:LysR substrate-binding domain-containing protein [Pseudomonadota bacterium]